MLYIFYLRVAISSQKYFFYIFLFVFSTLLGLLFESCDPAGFYSLFCYATPQSFTSFYTTLSIHFIFSHLSIFHILYILPFTIYTWTVGLNSFTIWWYKYHLKAAFNKLISKNVFNCNLAHLLKHFHFINVNYFCSDCLLLIQHSTCNTSMSDK